MVAVRVSYQHANSGTGNESVLLRFEEAGRDRSPCLLVDSGKGVDVDGLLGQDDYLAAVLLTHAHLDHYRTLAGNLRDGAPVYASTDTARILETVLVESEQHYELGDTTAALDAVEAVTGWEPVVGDVRIHPVPAGHAPGATGFLVEFSDGGDANQILLTGDFTRRRAAGYPGLHVGDADVEAVFLTGAATEDVETTLTEIVETAIERARTGSTTLLSASGLGGVHLAYLLGHVAERVDGPPVTVVGQAAKLYDELDYDVPNVTSVPEFASPTEVLAPGTVTVAGPEVPVDGSSARLFGYLREDPGATLLQVTGGATDPTDDGECTVYAYTLSNHPGDATIDAVVRELDPIEVVITHQSSAGSDRFKDRYDALTWATDGTEEYVLFDDGWQGPPWVHESTTRSVLADHYGPRLEASDDLPTPTRGGVDLAAEGLDVAALRARFDRSAKEGRESTGGSPESGGPEGDSPVVDADALASIQERLERIEAGVAGPTVRARVVDAGDGLTLLRLLDDGLDLEAGAELDVVVREPPRAVRGDGPEEDE